MRLIKGRGAFGIIAVKRPGSVVQEVTGIDLTCVTLRKRLDLDKLCWHFTQLYSKGSVDGDCR
jgi:hypothetical protein